MSPTTAQQTISQAPPLLRLAGMLWRVDGPFSTQELMNISLSPRCPSSCYILTRFEQHTNTRRSTTGSSAPGAQRTCGGDQLHRVVSIAEGNTSIGWWWLLGATMGSVKPRQYRCNIWPQRKSSHTSCAQSGQLSQPSCELAMWLWSRKY